MLFATPARLMRCCFAHYCAFFAIYAIDAIAYAAYAVTSLLLDTPLLPASHFHAAYLLPLRLRLRC